MTPKLLSFVVALLPLVSMAQNGTTRYSNQYGQPIGSATTQGSTTYYSNGYGQPIGTANTVGSTTYYSNQYGQPTGSAISPRPVNAPALSPQTLPPLPPIPGMPALPTLPTLN